MIPKETKPGTPVEIQFPDDQWQSGFVFVRSTGALDRDYRVVVEGNGKFIDGADPVCVRVEE